MNIYKEKINQLIEKTNFLLRKQDEIYKEIRVLQSEINKLKDLENIENDTISDIESQALLNNSNITNSQNENVTKKISTNIIETILKPKINEKSNIEKFIGENLINKIGIFITVIGVAIGAKYTIENNLISPIARIFLGYILGFGLLGFGIKLKSKYENYSAVLVSGAMAILYFITFFAYNIYHLIPQTLTFILMLFFTIFTVIASLNYNKQIIALFGMVGAYAIPFLLSNNEGNAFILFSYMTILNLGILFVSFKKLWKPLYYISFGVTWLIVLSWYLFKYDEGIHFFLSLTFFSVFYLIFYLNSISYKLIKNEKFDIEDVIMIISNSLIYYGIGYFIFKTIQLEKIIWVFLH